MRNLKPNGLGLRSKHLITPPTMVDTTPTIARFCGSPCLCRRHWLCEDVRSVGRSALQAMGGRIAFEALKNRGELAALGAEVLYRADTPVARVLLGTPAVLAT